MNHSAPQKIAVACSDNVVDFVAVYGAKQAQIDAVQAAYDDECARRARLEGFLTDLLAELEAA